MKIEEYERTGQAAYAGLSDVVANILAASLQRQVALRPQQIQSRAKVVKSLQNKLAKAKVPADAEIEPFAKDLAGARLIFYTNSDVTRFQNSGVLTDNFEIDWDRTKIHHPTAENPEASELFVSNNYVVRLKDDRAELPEYAEFAGLWCEVQVQTTLNHAWAEMAHDTIYKKPELQGFGADLMKGIETRMKAIMRDYLAPAGYAFQKVLNDFERLSRGQALFEEGVTAALEAADDKNVLHEALAKIADAVLPYFDDPETVAPDLLRAVAYAVARTRTPPVRPIQTPFGQLRGKTDAEVAKAAARIFEALRYIDVELTFSLLIDLYRSATDPDEAGVWTSTLASLAEHNLQVWTEAGPVVQMILVDQIWRMPIEEQLQIQPVILAILTQVFATDLSGTTSHGDTMTLRRGAVPASQTLRALRTRALDILNAFDPLVETDEKRSRQMACYQAAMAMPHMGRHKPDLAVIVYADIASIVRRWTDSVALWSFELRQSVEHDLLWLYRRSQPERAEEASAAPSPERAEAIAAILSFRDRVNADEDYTTYKLLVGFESVFPPAWEDPEFDYEQEEEYRAAAGAALVESISAENADRWRAILGRCARTESNDLATFPSFANFLEQLAREKPEIVLEYFETLDGRLANFLTPMLAGLAQTPHWSVAEARVLLWLAEGCHVSDIAFACAAVQALTPDILDAALVAAVSLDNVDAVFNVIRSASRRSGGGDPAAFKPAFLAGVDFMAARSDPRWVNGWIRRTGKSLLAILDAVELDRVITSLVAAPKITSSLEGFLADAAETDPGRALDFFGRRLARRASGEADNSYEDVPFSLHRLGKALASAPAAVVEAAREWFDAYPKGYAYHGGKLVSIVFPTYPLELEEALRPYVLSGERQDLTFAVEIFQTFSGQPALQALARDLVDALPEDDVLLTRVEIALEPSGVSSGEFGRVKRLKVHRQTIVGWADDPRDRVKAFATRYLKHLDSGIAAEQKRSEESSALRRLEWDDPAPNNADDG